jgi:hypothetical protein
VEETQEVVQQNIEESKITTGQRHLNGDLEMTFLQLFCLWNKRIQGDDTET